MAGNDEQAADLAILGAGPAGYPAAFRAADRGLRVVLIDEEPNPGGVCLYRGCIPSKALLRVTGVLAEARAVQEAGISFGEPTVDIDRLRAWKQSVVDRLTGGLGQLSRQRGIELVQGRGRFSGDRRLRVTLPDGSERNVAYRQAVVATGSRPVSLPLGAGSNRVLDSTSALALEDIPDRLLVIGGGYIGLELGQVYSALGSVVTVVEMLPGLLPGVDRDLVAPLAARLAAQFKAILLETKVTDIAEDGEALQVRFEGKSAPADVEAFDKVLIAVGRRPNTEDLGLEQTGARLSAGGFIEVDGQRRTSDPAVFAIGDVAGQPMLAHKATHEAHVAIDAAAGGKAVFEPQAIPAVVFTDPEIAWCGLTEADAAQRGIDVKISRFPWAASGRAATLGRSDGATKILADPGSGRVLGVAIAGHGAGELIAEGVLAIEMGALAEDIALTIHAHPTLSETMMEAAEGVDGRSTHFMTRGR